MLRTPAPTGFDQPLSKLRQRCFEGLLEPGGSREKAAPRRVTPARRNDPRKRILKEPSRQERRQVVGCRPALEAFVCNLLVVAGLC